MGKTYRHNDKYSPTDYRSRIRDRQECLEELFNEDNDFEYQEQDEIGNTED